MAPTPPSLSCRGEGKDIIKDKNDYEEKPTVGLYESNDEEKQADADSYLFQEAVRMIPEKHLLRYCSGCPRPRSRRKTFKARPIGKF